LSPPKLQPGWLNDFIAVDNIRSVLVGIDNYLIAGFQPFEIPEDLAENVIVG
jgi:hypothetical protein